MLRGTTTLFFQRTSQRLFTTQAQLEANKQLLSPVVSHGTDLVVESASGSWIIATNGERYLDFTTGIGVTNTGHCHPRVVEAIREAAGNVMHAQQNIVWHKPQLGLLQRLREVVAPNHEQFFFANSGAEAVEAALKLARHSTGRPNVVVMQGSFHGRSVGTMSMTTSRVVYRRNYQPLMPGVFVAPFPYCFRCPEQQQAEAGEAACCLAPIEALEELMLQQSAPDETAAVFVEPVLGEGGYVPMPAEYFSALRAFCDRHGILLVADEVQSGFGRTGRFLAQSHFAPTQPDITVMAKGIASGLPLSAIGSSRDIMSRWRVGTHGGTYGGNSVACAAACATIDAMVEEKMLENCEQRGQQLRRRLRQIAEARPELGCTDVRGLGLMVGMEFRDQKEGFTSRLVSACFDRNLLLLPTSIHETIRFIPPINVSSQDLDDGIGRFEDALDHTLKN